MFLYNFSKNKNEEISIFEKGKEPRITKLSHSFNNPQWSFQYHLHKMETELIYFSAGEANYSINTEVFHVQKGDLLVVEAGDIHSITSNPNDPISCWTCSIANYKIQTLDRINSFLPTNVSPHFKSGIHEGFIHEIFKEMDRIHRLKNEESVSICNYMACTLASVFYLIFQNAPQKENVKKFSFAQDVLIYINEHYADHITLKKLSEVINISPDHISHEFTKIYGISPINYVIERRLSEAKWLLVNTKDSLVSISQKVGYENTNHFSKLFTKRMGIPPLEFREKFSTYE